MGKPKDPPKPGWLIREQTPRFLREPILSPPIFAFDAANTITTSTDMTDFSSISVIMDQMMTQERNRAMQEAAEARARPGGDNGVHWVTINHSAPIPKLVLPKVTWDQVKGLDEAKAQLREFIEGPIKNKKIYEFYKKKPPKGVLLFGPPGCGKTMLVKAAASALAELHGQQESESGFIHAKAGELNDMYVGQTEKKIIALFEKARSHKASKGYPAIIFLDEADALLGTRRDKPHWYTSHVNAFLAEMDGFDNSSAIVILATNRPDALDQAVVRDGRIDYKIRIARPTKETAYSIIGEAMSVIPIHSGHATEQLIALAVNSMFSPERIFYEIETVQEKKLMMFSDFINGAMIANVVANATSIAMKRDTENSGEPTGLCAEDIITAVDNLCLANRDLDHKDDIAYFTESYANEIVAITKYRKEDQWIEEVA